MNTLALPETTTPRIDSRIKIIFIFTLIIAAASTPAHSLRAFIPYSALLLAFMAASRLSPMQFIKRALVMEPFILIAAVTIPFARHETGANLIPILGGLLHVTTNGLLALSAALAKGTLGVCALATLSATTPFDEIASALIWLRTPAALVQIATLMHRYAFVIVDEAARMKRAVESRGYRATNLSGARTIGHLIGSLFLRSFERAERVHNAMVSRGYTGEIPFAPLPAPPALQAAAAIFSIAAIISIRIFFI